MEKIFIVSAVRTPFGSFGGSLREVPVKDLAAHVIRGVVERVKLTPGKVQEIYLGVCCQAQSEEVLAPVIARQALLDAEFPSETVSLTMDRACCAGTAAIQMAHRSLRSGDVGVCIAGGAENMSLTPYVLHDLRWGSRLRNVTLREPLIISYRGNPVARDAGEVAMEYGITREEQDEWTLLSQKRYAAAKEAGKFKEEIIPITVSSGRKGETSLFFEDEFPRPSTTLERLAGLSTVYGSPTVTAGNAPGLNDGAAALLVMNENKAMELCLNPLAEIVATASVADNPRNIPVVPAYAIRKVIAQADLSVEDIELFEINEAFAAMPLTSAQILADGDAGRLMWIKDRTNVNGGAIAVGHPVGASGARIVMTLVYELRRLGGGYGVAAICGGMAQGDAVLVRV